MCTSGSATTVATKRATVVMAILSRGRTELDGSEMSNGVSSTYSEGFLSVGGEFDTTSDELVFIYLTATANRGIIGFPRTVGERRSLPSQ